LFKKSCKQRKATKYFYLSTCEEHTRELMMIFPLREPFLGALEAWILFVNEILFIDDVAEDFNLAERLWSNWQHE
jgi:hypothetical protein